MNEKIKNSTLGKIRIDQLKHIKNDKKMNCLWINFRKGKMNFKNLILTGLSLLFISGCEDKVLKEANQFYNEKKFNDALQKYELVLKKDENNQVAVLRIQECKKIIGEQEKEAFFKERLVNANYLNENGEFDKAIEIYNNLLIEQPSNALVQKQKELSNTLWSVKNNMYKFQTIVETYYVDNDGNYPSEINYQLYKNIFEDLIYPFKKERLSSVAMDFPLIIMFDKYEQYVNTGIFPGADNTTLSSASDVKIKKSDLKGLIVYKRVTVNNSDKHYEIYGVNEKGDLMKTVKKSY